MKAKESEAPPQWGMVELPLHADQRGRLTVAEGHGRLPFEVERVFWITDVPQGAERGGHAHLTCWEAVFAVSGQASITLRRAEGEETFRLSEPNRGLLIPPGVWCRLHSFAPGTALVVLASEPYKPESYVDDYHTL